MGGQNTPGHGATEVMDENLSHEEEDKKPDLIIDNKLLKDLDNRLKEGDKDYIAPLKEQNGPAEKDGWKYAAEEQVNGQKEVEGGEVEEEEEKVGKKEEGKTGKSQVPQLVVLENQLRHILTPETSPRPRSAEEESPKKVGTSRVEQEKDQAANEQLGKGNLQSPSHSPKKNSSQIDKEHEERFNFQTDGATHLLNRETTCQTQALKALDKDVPGEINVPLVEQGREVRRAPVHENTEEQDREDSECNIVDQKHSIVKGAARALNFSMAHLQADEKTHTNADENVTNFYGDEFATKAFPYTNVSQLGGVSAFGESDSSHSDHLDGTHGNLTEGKSGRTPTKAKDRLRSGMVGGCEEDNAQIESVLKTSVPAPDQDRELDSRMGLRNSVIFMDEDRDNDSYDTHVTSGILTRENSREASLQMDKTPSSRRYSTPVIMCPARETHNSPIKSSSLSKTMETVAKDTKQIASSPPAPSKIPVIMSKFASAKGKDSGSDLRDSRKVSAIFQLALGPTGKPPVLKRDRSIDRPDRTSGVPKYQISSTLQKRDIDIKNSNAKETITSEANKSKSFPSPSTDSQKTVLSGEEKGRGKPAPETKDSPSKNNHIENNVSRSRTAQDNLEVEKKLLEDKDGKLKKEEKISKSEKAYMKIQQASDKVKEHGNIVKLEQVRKSDLLINTDEKKWHNQGALEKGSGQDHSSPVKLPVNRNEREKGKRPTRDTNRASQSPVRNTVAKRRSGSVGRGELMSVNELEDTSGRSTPIHPDSDMGRIPKPPPGQAPKNATVSAR